MFVHDFVTVERPADEVVAQFARMTDPTLTVLARSAWHTDRDVWAELGFRVPDLWTSGPPVVRIGSLWVRDDAAVVPLAWKTDDEHPCFPDLDADVEIVTSAPDGAVLHLVGEYALRSESPGPTRMRRHRVTLMGLRKFLQSLGELMETGCSSIDVTA